MKMNPLRWYGVTIAAEALKPKATATATLVSSTAIVMPPGWSYKKDQKTNRYYFIDHVNKKTSWDDPRPFPTGWEVRTDAKTNKKYYINHSSRTTQWADPRTPLTGLFVCLFLACWLVRLILLLVLRTQMTEWKLRLLWPQQQVSPKPLTPSLLLAAVSSRLLRLIGSRPETRF
jgi:hypothetical protein